MILAGSMALLLSNALQAFNILLQVGAGTGLLFILRWFWWRINAYSEIAAMVVSFVVALYFQLIYPLTGLAPLSHSFQLVAGVGITTVAWISVTFLTQPTSVETLRSFYKLVQPGGPGWKQVVLDAQRDNQVIHTSEKSWGVPIGLLCMGVGCLAVYSLLFATGYWLYGNTLPAVGLTATGLISSYILMRLWARLA